MKYEMNNLNEEQREAYHLLEKILAELHPVISRVQDPISFDNSNKIIVESIFQIFKSNHEQIKDEERYKNAFLSTVRFKQDQLLEDSAYAGVFHALLQLDARATKNKHFFYVLLEYCDANARIRQEVIEYVVLVNSFLSAYQKINSYKVNQGQNKNEQSTISISPFATHGLAPLVNGDAAAPYRKGPQLVELFNEFGFRDIYDELGLPDIGKKNGHRPSRTEYTRERLKQLSDKPQLRLLLNKILAEAEFPGEMAEAMGKVLNGEPMSVVLNQNDNYIIEGGTIVNQKPVKNEAHFQEIQSRILKALDSAKVSIRIAMAWFTNETLRDKLVEKVNDGIDVFVAVYDDGINKTHGVDLSGIPHKFVKGTRGGIMHDKYCVIDNQIVMTGSYNWSTNAETRNDENVTVSVDPEQATRYSVRFRELFK